MKRLLIYLKLKKTTRKRNTSLFLFNTCLNSDSSSAANKCLLKVAHFSSELEQYGKAIEIYEQVNRIDRLTM